METKDVSTHVELMGKRTYAAPSLCRLGGLADLTASGSKGSPENTA